MKNIRLLLLRFFLAVSLIVFFAFFIFACSTETAIQGVLNRSASAPLFLECRAISPTEIIFNFSEPVKIKSLNFDFDAEIISIEEGEQVLITLSEPLMEGIKITADILVEDTNRNTLNVLVPFRSRNDRMPRLLFNELRTEGSNVTNPLTSRVEFMEFISESEGNLGAIRVYLASYSIVNPVYEFPAAEVKAGEYIVLHLRTPSPDCRDETGSDLALSGGNEATPNSREFWVPGSAKRLRKTDIAYIVDQDDRVLAGVLLKENPDTPWSTPALAAAADLLISQGAWLSEDVIHSASTTTTRTISRDETLTHADRSENWYITVTSGHTPGRSNIVRRLNP